MSETNDKTIDDNTRIMPPGATCADCQRWRQLTPKRGVCSYHVAEVVRPNWEVIDRYVITKRDDVCYGYVRSN